MEGINNEVARLLREANGFDARGMTATAAGYRQRARFLAASALHNRLADERRPVEDQRSDAEKCRDVAERLRALQGPEVVL